MTERLAARVVVIGAGPAGIAAAATAAEAGADTLLLDENPGAGGQIWRQGIKGAPPRARRWLERLERSGVRIVSEASVFDVPGETTLNVERGGEPLVVSWQRLILATGARELFLPFPGWTLPNVMGIGGAQAMVKAGASVVGQRVVVAGSGPLMLPVAATLAKAGAKLEIVAEQAAGAKVGRFALGLWRQPVKWIEAAQFRLAFARTRFRTGTWVVSAAGTDAVRSATLTDGKRSWTVECDLLATSYGLIPNLELPRLLGCAVDDDVVTVNESQETSRSDIFAAGELCGVGGADLALAEGSLAGLAAAGKSAPGGLHSQRNRLRRFVRALAEAFEPRRELLDRLTDDTFVCRCEDVPWGAIDPATEMRQAKLYHRVGMGPCQGRICGPALERLCGWEPDTVRPPLKPVSAATLAALGTQDD